MTLPLRKRLALHALADGFRRPSRRALRWAVLFVLPILAIVVASAGAR